jgi:ABC-type nitrate/sulfonate/bicarbonate transport system substrate-binding protein
VSIRRCGRSSIAVTAVVAIVFALTACGSSGPGASARSASGLASGALPKPTSVTLILDYIPNAVHAGIYRAIAAGYYARENIDLHVIQPNSTSETLKLIDAGRAQFGLADGIDVAEEIAAGHDAKAIMAITQLPLGAPIALASEHLTSPAQLQGRTVGITGVPSDTAVLDTVVSGAGGDPAKVHVVNVGFNGARALLAGRIAAFLGYWPADGVQLAVNGHPVTSFKLDHYGGPAYPGLVAFTDGSLIRSNPSLVRAFVAATVHGYTDTLKDPERSLGDLVRLNPDVQRRLAKASLDDYLPLFDDHGSVRFGVLRTGKVAALLTWMAHHRLIDRSIPASRFGTDEFLPSAR